MAVKFPVVSSEWLDKYGGNHMARTPEQRLCGAVVVRALLDVFGTANVTKENKRDAIWFVY
jgi:hypothetical protein